MGETEKSEAKDSTREDLEDLDDEFDSYDDRYRDLYRDYRRYDLDRREVFQKEFSEWSSGNKEIDNFIQQTQIKARMNGELIEWIPFDRLTNVEEIGKGGFGTVYKATWVDGYIKYWDDNKWERSGQVDVCLKSLNSSTNVNVFLQEVKNQLESVSKNESIINVFGITKEPTKNEYMMVMQYASLGSLRRMLSKSFKELKWGQKIQNLYFIAEGLASIHSIDLLHKDFHSGNIVNSTLTNSYITDFGLCKPISENKSENIYGVIPFMAPETLNKGEYTKASDIYSLGMIMYEVFTSYPPYYNVPHDEKLVTTICNGDKPETKCEIPQLLKNLMEKCWDINPQNRPTAQELKDQLNKYYFDKELRKQVNEVKKLNKNFKPYDSSEMHPKAIYTSRLIATSKKIAFNNEYDTYTSNQLSYSIPDTFSNNICVKDEAEELNTN